MPLSGIRGTHDIAWGSHVCLFYRSPKEFLRVTASFLIAGLAEQELGVWVLPPPVTIPLALNALSHYGIDGPLLQARQQLHIVSAQEWFSDGTFHVEDSLNRLATLPALARQLEYTCVRAAGGPGLFLSDACRQAFMRYERYVTPLIAALPFIGLCCYPSTTPATDMFDIMHAHPRRLLRTVEGWTSI
jgi:DcmR-like sensory protein